MNFDINKIARKNILKLVPYSSARNEFKGDAKVFLNANENSFGSPLPKWYNRYPDPLQVLLKEKISDVKGVPAQQILLGNGSDECIDLVIRAFCNPKEDNIIICPPTYGMYEIYGHINDVNIKEVPLTSAYQLDLEKLEAAIDGNTKVIFLCSPNNPTGNSLNRDEMEMIINNFDGIVVIDEAYINYSRQRSFTFELSDYPNLVVMQTFSKAWGLAALRLGMIFSSSEIIDLLNKIKPPYNINQVTQELAIKALDHVEEVNGMILATINERTFLIQSIRQLSYVEKIFSSDANFILVRVNKADDLYQYLMQHGIVVRNRNNVMLCEGCLRITVGTQEQNQILLEALKDYHS